MEFAMFNTHLDHISWTAREKGAALIKSRIPTDVPIM
jgi:hypothetical protein